MGSSIVVNLGPQSAASVRHSSPRKLFRGQLRTIIRKARDKCTSIANADDRSTARALAIDSVPALVFGAPNSVDGRAFARVRARLQACLDALEGDE